MRAYGATLCERNGFSLVEVLGRDAAGVAVVVGYAILNPDGDEIEFFQFYDAALEMFELLFYDNEPSRGYGM